MWASGPINVHEKRPASGGYGWSGVAKKKIVPIFKGGTFEFRGIHHMITVAQTDEDFVLLLRNTIRCRNSIFQQLTALGCVCLGIVDAKDEFADAPFLIRRWVVSWAHIRSEYNHKNVHSQIEQPI